VRARAALRAALPAGSIFLTEGLGEHGANALANGVPQVVAVEKLERSPA
jgi:hypothetical protein